MSVRFEGWPHIIRSQQFSRKWIEEELFPLTKKMQQIIAAGGSNMLCGKSMKTLFFQPSTRTRMSFQMAMHHLGGSIPFATENADEFSSSVKGESTEHTIKVACSYYPSVIVMRHKKEGAAEVAARVSSVPIINAGDGTGQHPTQALLDIFTIQEKLGGIDGISIVINGDLVNNRAARSLAYLLSKFNGVKIHFVSPPCQKMKPDVLEHLQEKGTFFSEGENLAEVIPAADVVYMLRTQREHGSAVMDWDNRYVLDVQKADMAKKSAIFMHPLPIDSRVKEIKPEVENDPRSVFLTTQVQSGLFVRMALLKMILAPDA